MVIYVDTKEFVPEENNLNYIPCSIKFNGKAKVSSYFSGTEAVDGVKNGSFRGRPLHGCEIDVPEKYCGYVLNKPDDGSFTQNQVFKVQQSFRKLTYWNLDRIPSKNDTFLSTLDWIDVSEAMHSKTSHEELKVEDENIVQE